jgi:3-oxoacyl-ACP reductase-like protein
VSALPAAPQHFAPLTPPRRSKIGLETLANRSISEGWAEYVSVTGCIIGWVRGTGLMDGNNAVAEQIEKLGLRTFSSTEMAFNLLGCLHPVMVATAQVEPIVADLGGGFSRLPDLAAKTASIRAKIYDEAARRRAIALDSAADFLVTKGSAAEALHQTVKIEPRALHDFSFPKLEASPADYLRIAKARGTLDLDKTVVVVGFGEVGPYGSSRTRWEIEADGGLSLTGAIELAWAMGFIKHHSGALKATGKTYVGWVEAKSDEPIADRDVKAKFEKDILAHTGIRVVEPELFRGYDPARKGFQQEIEILHDMEPMDVSAEEADKYRREHGDKVDVWAAPSGGMYVQLKRGARIYVPQSIKFSRNVAGQLPTGWDPKRYGIPEDICANVDRTALWTLVATTEALVSAGITDPYEIYKVRRCRDGRPCCRC